jgi:hypothetical protein
VAVVTSLDFLVYLHASLLPVLAEQRLVLAPSTTFPHLGLYGSDLGWSWWHSWGVSTD